MTANKLLVANNISKKFGNITVLNSLSFSINEGEIVGLLGDNGAGKSTLVKILSGVISSDTGFFSWQGREVSIKNRQDATTLGIETIFQDSALVNSMSIYRNIFLNRELTNRFGFLDHQKMRHLSEEVLETMTGIKGIDSAEKLVGDLSGGQRQAVAIARAVYFKNKILLLDEPTSALAVRATDALFNYLRSLRSNNMTSVLVTHDIFNAFAICDRFIVLSKGSISLDTPKSSITIEKLLQYVSVG
jgi:simple sugar transport system ATP-binding protein